MGRKTKEKQNSMIDKHNISISAKSIEEFNNIDSVLNTLPKIILKQIKSAKLSMVGVECVIEYVDSNIVKKTIYVPKNVSKIVNFGDYIGIYCDNFFFIIKEPLMNSTYDIEFLK